MALLTTVGFQITSNFANDYGDGVKGTDNDERIGPKRALQSGALSRKELKTGILVTIGINIILVLWLVYTAFGSEQFGVSLSFIVLGALSIWAAIKYTVGKSAYGYRGLGDLFVFLFFGLLGVLGSMYLYTQFLTPESILPAISIGLLSVGVLNLNNLRDFNSDRKSNKNTMVVLMGFEKGKVYHYFLILTSITALIAYCVIAFKGWMLLVPIIAIIPIMLHLKRVYLADRPELFDPELKKLALSTFLLAVLLYVSCNIFL